MHWLAGWLEVREHLIASVSSSLEKASLVPCCLRLDPQDATGCRPGQQEGKGREGKSVSFIRFDSAVLQVPWQPLERGPT